MAFDERRAGRQKFRGMHIFGGNGPSLMPAKIPPRSSRSARAGHAPRSTVDPNMQLSTLTPSPFRWRSLLVEIARSRLAAEGYRAKK